MSGWRDYDEVALVLLNRIEGRALATRRRYLARALREAYNDGRQEAYATLGRNVIVALGRLDEVAEVMKGLRDKGIEDVIPKERIVVLREISKEEAEKEILKLFSGGQVLYYSDIAEKLGLDLKLVVEICDELQSKGRIEVIDDALQSR